jgi:hypothetical protein
VDMLGSGRLVGRRPLWIEAMRRPKVGAGTTSPAVL